MNTKQEAENEEFEVYINYGTHSELYGKNLTFEEAIDLAFDWEKEDPRSEDQEFPFAHVQRTKETPVAA